MKTRKSKRTTDGDNARWLRRLVRQLELEKTVIVRNPSFVLTLSLSPSLEGIRELLELSTTDASRRNLSCNFRKLMAEVERRLSTLTEVSLCKLMEVSYKNKRKLSNDKS